MRRANVYRNNELVGILSEESPTLFVFQYDENWLLDSSKPSVSLTLPKVQKVFTSPNLFPFFFNMLSEGINKQIQCRLLKIDEKDHFGLLLATAQNDTLGAITVKPINV